MEETRKLARGELTEIIIGTVVAAGDDGINAKVLAEKLNSWNIKLSSPHAGLHLAKLAREGRIERIRTGIYKGV